MCNGQCFATLVVKANSRRRPPPPGSPNDGLHNPSLGLFSRLHNNNNSNNNMITLEYLIVFSVEVLIQKPDFLVAVVHSIL